MSLYVLDTDHVSLYQRGHPLVTAKVLVTPPELLAVPIITAEEQARGRLNQIRRTRTGPERIQAYQRLREAFEYFAHIRLLDYDAKAEAHYQSLRQQQIRIGTQDLRIAAIALSFEAVLVTRNQQDFGRIPGLATEDWSL